MDSISSLTKAIDPAVSLIYRLCQHPEYLSHLNYTQQQLDMVISALSLSRIMSSNGFSAPYLSKDGLVRFSLCEFVTTGQLHSGGYFLEVDSPRQSRITFDEMMRLADESVEELVNKMMDGNDFEELFEDRPGKIAQIHLLREPVPEDPLELSIRLYNGYIEHMVDLEKRFRGNVIGDEPWENKLVLQASWKGRERDLLEVQTNVSIILAEKDPETLLEVWKNIAPMSIDSVSYRLLGRVPREDTGMIFMT